MRLFAVAVVLAGIGGVVFADGTGDLSIDELREIAEESWDAIKTGRVVCIAEHNSSMVPAQYEPNSIRYKHWMVDNHQKHRVALTIDCNMNSFFASYTDLRDVNELLERLERYGLPEKDYETLCNTGEKVVREKIILVLKPGSVRGREGFLILNNTEGYDVCGTLWEGIIPSRIFSQASNRNVTFTVIESEEGDLLRVEFSYGKKGNVRKKIVCDPSLGYRYNRIEHYYKDWLITEEVASDYRMIDGVPYPFLQIQRRFNEEGDLIIERTKTVESVELNMAISDEELKIFVPEGTIFQSVVENKSAYGHIKQGRYIGIEEALEMADSLAK